MNTRAVPTPDAVRDALRGVIDPELHDDVVSLGMVRDIQVATDGDVNVTLALTTAGCPLKVQLRDDTKIRVSTLPGVANVRVTFDEMTTAEKSALMSRARLKAQDSAPPNDIPATCRVLAISSGKGGVGKSSVTANLAISLAEAGHTVGVLDADIWGFSIPRMLGMEGSLDAEADTATGRPRITPKERQQGAGRLRVLSMGFLAGEDEAVMWRGLMLSRALQHFLEDVVWGDLDYLLVDMPPGTGDIQMALARMLPRAELIVVTTPALAAQMVATRAADMARKGHLRVAGVIENMAGFTSGDGVTHELFGSGGGQRLADDLGVPLLGSIPLEASVATGGDNGVPTVTNNQGPAATALRAIATRIRTEIAPPVGATALASCTAHMLDAMTAALDAK